MLAMRQYIERKNVERFIGCLSTETDPVKRIILLKLLSEEEPSRKSLWKAKVDHLHRPHRSRCAGSDVDGYADGVPNDREE